MHVGSGGNSASSGSGSGSGSGGGSGADARGSAIHDGAMMIDLRSKPTRAELGYPADTNFVVYQSAFDNGGKPIATTVILPTGSLHLSATKINANDGNPLAVGDDPHHLRPPLDIQVTTTYPDVKAARAAVAAQLPTLLVGGGVDVAAAQAAMNGGATFDYRAGGLRDWLDVGFTIGDPDQSTGGTVDVTYDFGIDHWHSPWIDAVVHNGVYTADLTKAPTRAALGMRDTYWNSPIAPYPGTTMSVALKLPTGTLTRRVDGVTAESDIPADPDKSGVNQPSVLTVDLHTGKNETVLAELLADAPLLGVAPSAIQAVYDQSVDKPSGQLTGATTPVYSVSIKFSFTKTLDYDYSATAKYIFTFRR